MLPDRTLQIEAVYELSCVCVSPCYQEAFMRLRMIMQLRVSEYLLHALDTVRV